MREDAPEGETLVFETNVGDVTRAGPSHPLRFERGAHDGVKPYVHVRGGLWARLTRPLAHDLVDIAVEREQDDEAWLGICLGGRFLSDVPGKRYGGDGSVMPDPTLARPPKAAPLTAEDFAERALRTLSPLSSHAAGESEAAAPMPVAIIASTTRCPSSPTLPRSARPPC